MQKYVSIGSGTGLQSADNKPLLEPALKEIHNKSEAKGSAYVLVNRVTIDLGNGLASPQPQVDIWPNGALSLIGQLEKYFSDIFMKMQ